MTNANSVELWRSPFGQTLSRSGPLLFLQTGSVAGVPHGLNLTTSMARTLAVSLRQGVQAMEADLTGRCACGEPIEVDEDDCVLCEVAQSRLRRAALRAL